MHVRVLLLAVHCHSYFTVAPYSLDIDLPSVGASLIHPMHEISRGVI